MDQTLKITDVNIDCLEKIKENLEIIDLLNAADANKELNYTAKLIFHRRHRHKTFMFGEPRLSPTPLIQTDKDFVDISDLRTSLKFLRCFGGFISNIVLYRFHDDISEMDHHIIDYINKYCSGSIKNITVRNSSASGLEHFKFPFINVENVSVQNCSAEKEWLTRTFPKVRQLKLCPSICNSLLYNGCTANHFPYLEHLEICSSTTRGNIACRDNVLATVRLNPQLKSLRVRQLCTSIDLSFFQESTEYLQNLETLEFTFGFNFFQNFTEGTVHLPNVKHVEIYGFDNTDVHPSIPFQFDKLESLSFSSYEPLDERFYRFIIRHSTIKELKITNHFPNEAFLQQWKGIAKSLPLLQSEMDFSWIKFSIEDAITFMEMFKLLKSFRFELNKRSDYKRLQAILNVDWLATINEYNIVKLERSIVKY